MTNGRKNEKLKKIKKVEKKIKYVNMFLVIQKKGE